MHKNAFKGQNGVADYRRDFSFRELKGRLCPKTQTGFIRPIPGGHQITLGTLGGGFAKSGLTPREIMTLARRVVRHEVCHARWTDFSVGPAAVREGIPFPILNVFEDVRIEAREVARLESAVFGGGRFARRGFRWRWHKWVTPPRSTDPLNLILAWKYGWRGESIYSGPALSASGKSAIPILRSLFHRAQAAASTGDLLPIIREFLREFPSARESKPYADPGESLSGEEGDGEADDSGSPPLGEGCEGDPSPASPKHRQPSDYGFERDPSAPDAILSGALRGIARGLMTRTEDCRAEIGASGDRIHLPGILSGDSAFRRVGGRDLPRLTLILDMSSSMQGPWVRGLREVAVAMASIPGIQTSVWLSGGGRCEKVSPSDAGGFFPSHGSESIRRTLSIIDASEGFGDVVIVLTDGDVTDGDVDGAAYRARGVRILGAVAGHLPPRYLEKFVSQFGRVLVRETPAQLVRDIVNEVNKAR